jgi:hypothetical protein
MRRRGKGGEGVFPHTHTHNTIYARNPASARHQISICDIGAVWMKLWGSSTKTRGNVKRNIIYV